MHRRRLGSSDMTRLKSPIILLLAMMLTATTAADSASLTSDSSLQLPDSVAKQLVETVDLDQVRDRAHRGSVTAMMLLASMYYHGQVVPLNYSKAAKWYRSAANQGNAKAQYILGLMYNAGQGVSQNKNKATKWCRRAAEQGHLSRHVA